MAMEPEGGRRKFVKRLALLAVALGGAGFVAGASGGSGGIEEDYIPFVSLSDPRSL